MLLVEIITNARYLYHGTSSVNLKSILEKGIRGPSYWGSTPEMAMYYAEGEVQNEAPPFGNGSENDYPVVFQVAISRLSHLAPDRAAAQEPITTVLDRDEEEIFDEWQKSPQDATASIDILGSVKCLGDVKVTEADIIS